MKILAIETSCDETAAAVVENGSAALSDVRATSLNLHQETGGIVPEVAARKQLEHIAPVISQAVADHSPDEIESIAVTVGPGLIGSLLIGVEAAKTLSLLWGKPLIPVNHLLGHVYANFIDREPNLPAVALIVSGGHTDLIYLKNHQTFRWLGGTRDDAAGEAFDKVARMLGLADYPGGPAIEKASLEGDAGAIAFPRPMIDSGDYDFSFSGLKTAVMNKLAGGDVYSEEDLAASFQEAVAEVLVAKTLAAAEENGVKTILLAGGVAANKRLRELLVNSAGNKFAVFIPPLNLCMDNAVYIASRAFFAGKAAQVGDVRANPGLSLRD